MNPMMRKLLEKKHEQGKTLSDDESDAQMSVLNDLKNHMGGMIGDKLKDGLKKVSVASDSSEGLKAGLDRAKEMLPGGKHEDSPPEEASESPEDELKEDADMSPDELDAKIQHLMSLKKMKEQHS